MSREERRDLPRVGTVRPDAKTHRVNSAQDEETVEWSGDAALGVLVPAIFLEQPPRPKDESPADQVAVASEVLRGRVHDDVRAEFERALEDRRGERVVDRDPGAAGPSEGDRSPQVGDLEQRIRRRLEIEQVGPRGGGECSPHVREVGRVDEVHVDPVGPRDLEQSPGPRVEVVPRYDAAPARVGHEERRGRGESRAERESSRRPPPVDRGPSRARRGSGCRSENRRIPWPFARGSLRERRREIDRHVHRAGERVGFLSVVDESRVPVHGSSLDGNHPGTSIIRVALPLPRARRGTRILARRWY